METGVDEGAPSVDCIHGHVRRQLNDLQLHRQGWRSQKQESYQYKGNENQNKCVPGIYLTRHHGIGLGQPHLSDTGLFFGVVKCSLTDPKADLKLAIFLSRLRIIDLGYPPLSEETPGIVAIVRVGAIRRRGQRRRCSIRGLAGPGKRTKTVIQNESIDKSE